MVLLKGSPRNLNTVGVSNTLGSVSKMLGWVSNKTGSICKKGGKSEMHQQFSQIGLYVFKVVRKSFNFASKGRLGGLVG